MQNNRLQNRHRSICTLFQAIQSDMILTSVSMQKKGADVRKI
jgi:hypothetical protein